MYVSISVCETTPLTAIRRGFDANSSGFGRMLRMPG
jgi:hypothetical protein